MSSEAELNKLKVADLTELLKEKGLPTKGNKADLVAVPYPALLPQAPRCFPPRPAGLLAEKCPPAQRINDVLAEQCVSWCFG